MGVALATIIGSASIVRFVDILGPQQIMFGRSGMVTRGLGKE